MKISNREKRAVYHIALFSVLITMNIFFFFFTYVMDNGDSAPNFAFAVFTLLFAFLEIRKAFQLARRKK